MLAARSVKALRRAGLQKKSLPSSRAAALHNCRPPAHGSATAEITPSAPPPAGRRAASTITINHLQVNKSIFASLDEFTPRHLGPRDEDRQRMLEALGFDSIDAFVDQVIPPTIRIPEAVISDEALPPLAENELARRAAEIAEQNVKAKNFIGMGYHQAVVPPVIKRNVRVFLRAIVCLSGSVAGIGGLSS